MESVGLPDDDIDSTRTSLPPQTKLQERTVSQQRTTGHFLRFLCLLNLYSLTTYLFTSFSGNRPKAQNNGQRVAGHDDRPNIF